MERAIISGLRSSSFSFLLNSIVEPRRSEESETGERKEEKERERDDDEARKGKIMVQGLAVS